MKPIIRHVVWDWNGTLFDDLHIVLEAVNRGLDSVGASPIGLSEYRDYYTRPVRVFYDRVFGRELNDMEWRQLDERFHESYLKLLNHARLAPDALDALEVVRGKGITQSLLSMFPHEHLVPLVEQMGLDFYFQRIDGLDGIEGQPGDAKSEYLAVHLEAIIGREDPTRVLLVGDTPDDALAAREVGTQCVLVDNGSQHRGDLEREGVPVVDCLLSAVLRS